MNMKLSPVGLDSQPAVSEICRELAVTFDENGCHLNLIHTESADGLTVQKSGNTITITYSQTVYLFRGLGLAAENSGKSTYTITQHALFHTSSVMMDCSRNGVLKVDAVKSLLRKMALMGHNTLMLYTEDTYEIPGEPYFGQMRGRYTHEELKELDDYAAGFGIEMVPCIQTLAHLQSALRWSSYKDIIDTGDILLAEEDKTYQLIERMIAACRSNFRSRRINIGMDEAMMVGRGAYQDRHGYQNSFDIMCRHLDRVIKICEKFDFHPEMWSDMFFHIVNGGYYNEGEIPEEELAKVPKNVDLAYWDYYSDDKAAYDRNLKKHLQFHNRIAFTGGAWKWTGYTPKLFHSLKVSRTALDTCVENGIDEVIVTAWGDNGAEASPFSILPVIQLYAEYGFQPDLSDADLARRLKTCTGISLDNFRKLDLPDRPSDTQGWYDANPSKYLLFQDILCGLFDQHVNSCYASYYVNAAAEIARAGKKEKEYGYIFESLAALCEVLALKCDIGVKIKNAYDKKDKDALCTIAKKTLPKIAANTEKFRDCIEAQWFRENKAFGFEVQDIRISGVIARTRSAARRILQYANGEIDRIEELEAPRLYFDGRAEKGDRLVTTCNQWNQIATACNL